jgi:hypothetical protein
VTAEDVVAQAGRCTAIRQEIREVEQTLDDISDSEPLSTDGDYKSNFALAESSLEVTSSASDIEDDYFNTEYAVFSNRLQKLLRRLAQVKKQVSKKREAASQNARNSAKSKPLSDSKAGDAAENVRAITLQQLQEARKAERAKARELRRMRLLAQHGATLDAPKPKKKKKKVTSDDEAFEEDYDSDQEQKRVSPNDISEILAGLKLTGHFKKLTYFQRWKLKIYNWEQVVKGSENVVAALQARIAKCSTLLETLDAELKANPKADLDLQIARTKNKIVVLEGRVAANNEEVAAVWNKINARLQKLQKRLEVTPGKTRITRKLNQTEQLRVALLTAFYPEQLPKPKPKPVDSDEED